jgi:hypothetical protein
LLVVPAVKFTVLTCSLLIAACATDDGTTVGGAATGKADGTTNDLPTLSFERDWSVAQSAPLVKGGAMRIHYDPRRLPDCRAQSATGKDMWRIVGYFSLDEVTPLHDAIPVTRLEGNGRLRPPSEVAFDAVLEVPLGTFNRGHDLGLWFVNTDDTGCTAYDSNFGGNFHFVIQDAPE